MRRKPKVGDLGRSSHSAHNLFADHQMAWIFQCSMRPALHSATLDAEGTNLPADVCAGGLWERSGQLFLGPDNLKSVGIDMVALKLAIAKEGFFLWNADIEPLPKHLRLMR